MKAKAAFYLALLTLSAAFASAGCDLDRSTGAAPNQTSEVPDNKTRGLVGTWQVAKINSGVTAALPAIGLHLTDKELRATSGCITWAWQIERGPSRVRVGELRPIPVCERGRTPQELDFLEVMDAHPEITAEDGNLLIAGEAGSMIATHNLNNN